VGSVLYEIAGSIARSFAPPGGRWEGRSERGGERKKKKRKREGRKERRRKEGRKKEGRKKEGRRKKEGGTVKKEEE